MRRYGIGLAVAAIAIGALPGCGLGGDDGGGSDRDAVEQVMSDLESASRDGDGSRICEEIFTPKLSSSVTRSSSSGSCASEVKANMFSPDTQIEVESISVPDGSSATAMVKESNGNVSRVFLVKQGDEWRIRGVTPA